ncbi:hypothetical protein, partial [Escherichia coli]|uniref:hypothetical protein n=1 Tax=Escherichia coli TaxID=562 RepID=UPI0035E3F495
HPPHLPFPFPFGPGCVLLLRMSGREGARFGVKNYFFFVKKGGCDMLALEMPKHRKKFLQSYEKKKATFGFP